MLPEDLSAKDKRERLLGWQKVNRLCWVGHHEFVGFFFFVCPCGAASARDMARLVILSLTNGRSSMLLFVTAVRDANADSAWLHVLQVP